ncbi:MAG: phosphoglucosamine mutase [Nitrospirae bacterium]|nr:phosphoglucosamine mutase [Nitrospirota bacterium]
MKRKLFGTDGIRGTANMEPMTSETAVKLGRAVAYIFKNRKGHHRIVIGKDTRLSGYMFEGALTSGICSMGVDVLLVGPMPTPAIAFLTRSLRADAGAVISASHNLFEDNGIKFFSAEGLKLPDSLEEQIEEMIFSGALDHVRPTGDRIGKAYRIDDAEGRYIEFAKNSLPKGMTFEGLKLVVDCAHGAAYKITPSVLRELGAEIVTLGDRPDGTNINQDCGALHPELIQQIVREQGAHAGLAHDGDADRVILVDERGTLVDGDRVMAMCAMDLKEAGRLKQNTLVATVMSNIGLEIAMKKAGIALVRTDVGDRYVLEEMLRRDCNLGGEQSGHVIFLDHNTTGDGLITVLQTLSLMQRKQKSLSELANCMTVYPQTLINVKVREKKNLSSIPEVATAIRKAEEQMNGTGRILVRYSGTELKARVMVEGERESEIHQIADEVAETIRRALS